MIDWGFWILVVQSVLLLATLLLCSLAGLYASRAAQSAGDLKSASMNLVNIQVRLTTLEEDIVDKLDYHARKSAIRDKAREKRESKESPDLNRPNGGIAGYGHI